MSGRRFINGLKKPIKLIDSTLISLCMSSYDWALYTHTKGAIKLHTVLDFDTYLPKYVYITDGKIQIIKLLNISMLNQIRLLLQIEVIVIFLC